MGVPDREGPRRVRDLPLGFRRDPDRATAHRVVCGEPGHTLRPGAGDAEKVTVEEALRAVTIEAAYQLRMDDEIGTIEAGKRADFAVLEDDPLEVAPEDLRDVRVWGTVLGGVIYEAEKTG